jgi:uncharacterized protein with beta-barrel porin domain
MRKIFSLYVVMFLIVVPSLVHAANYTATGTGDWDDPAIWDLLSVPGSGDTVEIPIDQVTGGVSINSGVDAVAQSVRLAIKDGLLTMNGGNLTLTDGLWGQKTGTQVIFAQSGTIIGDVGANDPLSKKLAHININGGVTATIDGDVQTPYIRLPGSVPTQTFRLGSGRTLTGDIRVGSSGGGFNGNQGIVEFLGTATVNGNIGEVWQGRLKQLTLNSGDVSVVGDVRSESYDLKGSTLALTGTGNITQVDSGTIWTQVTNATSYGRITATGAATIPATATVSVDVLGYVPANSVFTVVDGTGGIGVSADMPVTSSSIVVSFTSNPVASEDLTITSSRTNSYNNIATNSNTSAVGSVLESIGAAGATGDMLTVLNALDSLPTAAAVEQALESLIPVVDAGVINLSASVLNNFVGVVMDRLRQVTLSSTGDSATTGVSTGEEGVLKGLWARGYGSYLTQGARKNVRGYDAWNLGTALGIDRLIGESLTLGISGGYAYGNVDSDANNATTDINSAQTTIYGGYQDANYPFFIDAAGSFAYNWYDGERDINIGGVILRKAKADYGGQQYGAYLGGGYKIDVTKNIEFTPLVSLQWTHLRLNRYVETEAGSLNLRAASQSFDLLQSGVGARIASPIKRKWGTLTPEIHGKWLYDFIGDPFAGTSSFSGGGGAFNSNGAKPARNSFIAGGQLVCAFKNDFSVILDCDTELKDKYFGIFGSATLRYNF